MSLIAHYKLDGNANDALGKYDGTASNVTWVDGKLGQCAYFSSTPTSAINLGNVFNVGAGELSVSLWFNPNSYSDTYLFSKARAAGQVSRYALRLKTDGKLTVLVAPVNAAAHIDYDCNTNIKLNTWTHACIVFSRNNPCRVYVNGIIDREFTPPYFKDTNFISDNPFKIGAYTASDNISNSISFDGLIDDVRIYDHALSEREVRDLSQGLVLHYTFDQFQEPTENLLRKSGAAPLVSVGDIHGGSTKTINADGSVRFVNNSTDGATVRLYCNLADLSNGETYAVQVKFRENTGTVSLDWCDTSIINGVSTSTQSSGLLYGIGTRSTYDETYRFLDISMSSGGSVTLYEDQIEKKKYTTPFVNGTRAGIVRDQSTQGNDAPLVLANTPKWVEGGMVGKGCYEFDGVNDYIDISSKIKDIRFDRGFTLSCWAFPTIVSSWARFLDIGVGQNNNNIVFSRYSTTDQLFFKVYNGASSGAAIFGGSIPLNSWSLLTVTVSESMSTVLYINGVQVATGTSTSPQNVSRSSSFIAKSNWNWDSLYKGQIDDVRIYTTALSAEEIRELYQQRASLDSHGNFYSSLISSNIGYQKVWGDGSGVKFPNRGMASVSTNGVLRFTTINTDPMINMYNLGSFDPNVYKFIQVKYRVVSGNAGSVEIFFTNTQYTMANAAQAWSAPLNSDGNWNVVTVAMHTHPNWTNSNITGWRFDMGTVSGVTIEVEWIRLVSDTGALSVKSNKVVGNFSEVGITNGLVAYYPLNKDAKDYSGNGYHGTVTDAVLTGGGFDGKGAYSFDNTGNQFINLVDENFAGFSDFSMSVWVNPKGNHKNYDGAIVSSGDWNRAHWAFSVLQNNSGIRTRDPAITVNHTIPLNAWTQIAWVRQGTLLSVYVDGVLRGSATNTANIPLSSGYSNTKIGGDTYVYPTHFSFNGEICNVKIFNRALTPEEIAVEYKRTGVSKMTQHNGTVYIQGQVKETI